MRKLTYKLLLLYICVILGVAIELPGALGSVIRLSQFAALGVWALSLFTITRKLRRPHPLQILFGVFILWNLTTFVWSMDPTETLLHFARSVMMLLMSIAVWDVFRTTRQSQGLRQAIVAAGYVLVCICVVNFRSGIGKTTDETRFSAGALDPNDMGLILAVIIPIAWHLFLDQIKRRGPVKYLNMLYPAVALSGIMLSGSRGSIVAALPGLLYILWSYKRLPIALRAAIPVIIVAGLAFAVKAGLSHDENISKNLSRLESVAGSASDDKLSGRIEIWAAGWDVFRHHPFFGIGSGAFPESTRSYPVPRNPVTGIPYVAHNTYLSIATETGLVGFIIFLAAVISVFRSVWAMGPSLRWGWLSSLCSLMLGAVSLSWDFRPYIWVFLTAAVIAARAAMDDSRRAPQTGSGSAPHSRFQVARNSVVLPSPLGRVQPNNLAPSVGAEPNSRGVVS